MDTEDRAVSFTKSDKITHLRKGEKFRQCYDPEKPVLKELPEYWFVSRYGTVLSYNSYSGKIKCLKNNENEGKYSHPKLGYRDKQDENKQHCIRVHTLVALVYGDNIFGKAKDILKEKGKEAFGNSENPDNLQAHHIEGIEGSKLYNPEYVQILRAGLHRVMDSEDTDIIKHSHDLINEVSKDTDGKPAIITESITNTKTGKTKKHIEAIEVDENKIVMRFKRKEDIEFLQEFLYGTLIALQLKSVGMNTSV